MTAFEKYEKLKTRLAGLSAIAVAFSGGVDSTLLLLAAHEALGERCVAVTARSCNFPERELRDAVDFCTAHGIRHFIVDNDELSIAGYAENPPDRCYICKIALLNKFRAIADECGISDIAEGTNFDDNIDDRPGFRAVVEQGVLSPLRDAELSKPEIRELLGAFGLTDAAQKPSLACLSSRFPYGERITAEGLARVERAERILFGLGIRQLRVRHHGKIARIETDVDGFALLQDRNLRESLYAQFRELGFDYTTLDLLGYRTGSLSEVL